MSLKQNIIYKTEYFIKRNIITLTKFTLRIRNSFLLQEVDKMRMNYFEKIKS